MADELELRDKLALPEKAKERARIVAEEIARQVAFHIETMYPEAVKAASSTFLLSVKGTVINSIMALKDADRFYATLDDWLRDKANHRKAIRKLRRMAERTPESR